MAQPKLRGVYDHGVTQGASKKAKRAKTVYDGLPIESVA